jgi:TrmH family RNA methyltransferase
MITSVNNGQVKNIIQLNQKTKARREQGLFVAEGRKMFGEAPRDWISKVYVSEALSGDAELMAQVEKLPYEIVTDSVFRQMSDTQTPQGIMTVLKKPSYIMEDILGGKNPLVMILEDLQDPGNAGTILRTGEGAGGYTINHGFCLQNAFPICGKCGIISTGTERQKYPHICGASAW